MLIPSSISRKCGPPHWFAGFAVLTLLPGCQLFFGSYEMDPNAGSGGRSAEGQGGSSTGGTTAADCRDGDYTCTPGGTLQGCDSGAWRDILTCDKPSLCNKDQQRCDTCGADERRCSSDGRAVEVCRDTNDGWNTQACAAAQLCDAVLTSCVLCRVGESHCDTDPNYPKRLKSCSPNQLGWDYTGCGISCSVRTGGTDYCVNCTQLDQLCSGDGKSLITCSNIGEWVSRVCTNQCVLSASGVASCT